MAKKLEGISWSDDWEDDVEYEDDYAKLLANYLEVNYNEVRKLTWYNYEAPSTNAFSSASQYYVGTYDELFDIAVEEFIDEFDMHPEWFIDDESLQWSLQKAWDYDEYGDIENYDNYDIAKMLDKYIFAEEAIEEWGVGNQLGDDEEEIGQLNGEKIYAVKIGG